jgi:hypothetical protein
MGDYQTEDEIQNAYGYAIITEKEREELLKLLQDSEEKLFAEDAAVHFLRLFKNTRIWLGIYSYLTTFLLFL